MSTDAELIRDWYKLVKQNSACITCQREGLPAEPGKVEFHHIDASSKCDTLSNMAIRPIIMPLRYAVTPVTYAIELMKVAPMCSDHHRELHRSEDRHEIELLREKYDFTDPFYVRKVTDFRKSAIHLAPYILIGKINDGLMDMLHGGQIAFTENGFELAGASRSMDYSTLSMFYEQVTPSPG